MDYDSIERNKATLRISSDKLRYYRSQLSLFVEDLKYSWDSEEMKTLNLHIQSVMQNLLKTENDIASINHRIDRAVNDIREEEARIEREEREQAEREQAEREQNN